MQQGILSLLNGGTSTQPLGTAAVTVNPGGVLRLAANNLGGALTLNSDSGNLAVLGLAYLTNIAPAATNIATAIIMAVGLAGIIRAVVSKQSIRCACLGTGFNIPMSTVTIIENFVMLVMAVASVLG